MSKSSQAAQNYFGTVAGAVCAGPVDELVALIIDGKTVWPTDKGWADDVVEVPIIAVERKSDHSSRAYTATPHNLKNNSHFVLTGLASPYHTFNCATVTVVQSVSDYVFKFTNATLTPTVAKTSVPEGGLLTKVVTYGPGDVVRYLGSIWQCVLNHYGTPDTAPPNATYWTSYIVRRVDVANPFGFDVADSVQKYGRAYFYWGTTDQTLDTVGEVTLSQNGHPPYRRQAVIVLKDFLFGSERQAAPNVQVVVRRRPAQTLIVGSAAGLDSDGQANPKCAEIAMLTDTVFGPGRPNSAFGVVSAQAVADAIYANSDKTYISPILDSQNSARSFLAVMLAYYDGWLRFNGDGEIESGRFIHNEAPPTFTNATTIDYNDLIEEIEWDAEGWSETFNETVVKFKDRARAYKDAGQTFVSGFNRQVTGEPRRVSIERPFITREGQALSHAAEWGKINAQPKLSGTLKVRAEKATSIRQGDLFKLTHDAASLSIVCRCTEKTLAAPPVGSVSLRFESERGVAPIPYSPTVAAPDGTTLPGPEQIQLYQFVQPPPQLIGNQNFNLIILAARTSALTRGFRPWLKVDDASNFYQLGEQRHWSIKGALAQDYAANLPVDDTSPQDDGTETLQLNMDDLTVQPDLENISATQTDDAINDASLLVWLFSAGDPTQYEICTLKAIRIDSGVYKLKVRRAQFGTTKMAFLTGDVAFIGYRSDLVSYTHQLFGDYAKDSTPTTFRLQAFTATEEADLSDSDLCPDITFTFADPYAPTAVWILEQAAGVNIASFSTVYTPSTVFKFGFNLFSPAGSLVDANLIAKLSSLEINLWSQNFDATSLAYGETTFSLPSDGVWSVCLVLRDASGRVSRTFLSPVGGGSYSIIIIETGGGGGSGVVLTPYALPPRNPRPFSSYPADYSFNVTLQSATAGAMIYYQVTPSLNLSTTPVEPSQTLPGAWIAYTVPFNIYTHIHSFKRVWMFATHAAMTNSPTGYVNY